MAKANFPGFEVVDRMETARGVPSVDAWLGGVGFALKQLAALKRGDVRLEELGMWISGETEDLAAYRAVKSALANSMPKGIKLTEDLVTPPVVSPFTWAARLADGRLVLSGYVPSEAARAELLAAAKASVRGAVIDQMQPGDGAPQGWSAAAAASIRGLAQMSYRQRGDQGHGPHDLRARRRMALRPMPPAPHCAPPCRRPSGLPTRSRRRSRRHPRPTACRAGTIGHTAAGKGGRNAGCAGGYGLAAGADLSQPPPAPATPAPPESKPAPTPAPPPEAAVRSPPQTAVDIKAKACEDQLQGLVRTGQIAFEFASAELDPASLPTLDKLAQAAKTCPGMQIEVGGHASSEGSAIMNQQLSLKRARSVVTYLVEAGVDADAAAACRLRSIAPGRAERRQREHGEEPAHRVHCAGQVAPGQLQGQRQMDYLAYKLIWWLAGGVRCRSGDRLAVLQPAGRATSVGML